MLNEKYCFQVFCVHHKRGTLHSAKGPIIQCLCIPRSVFVMASALAGFQEHFTNVANATAEALTPCLLFCFRHIYGFIWLYETTVVPCTVISSLSSSVATLALSLSVLGPTWWSRELCFQYPLLVEGTMVNLNLQTYSWHIHPIIVPSIDRSLDAHGIIDEHHSIGSRLMNIRLKNCLGREAAEAAMHLSHDLDALTTGLASRIESLRNSVQWYCYLCKRLCRSRLPPSSPDNRVGILLPCRHRGLSILLSRIITESLSLGD